jgi:glycosyltransferase involved in cell wall biosynthesis
MSFPLISILLPVYNAENYVQETIASILAQTYTHFELIVINDGSTDRSQEIIDSFNDKRIITLKNEHNIRLIATLNLGLQKAKGKYIARIDADDIMLPNRISKQVMFLEENLDYGMVGSYVQTFGDVEGSIFYPLDDASIRYTSMFYNPFVHSTVMLRASVIATNLLDYDSTMLHVEDYALWIQIMRVSKVANLPEILVRYRVHAFQISTTYSAIQQVNTMVVQQNYLQSLGFSCQDALLISKLFSTISLDFDFLMYLLKKVHLFGETIQLQEFSERFRKDILRFTKTQILSKKTISFSQLNKIRKNKHHFTSKQFFSLTLKFLKF